MKQPAKFVKIVIYGLLLGSVALSAQADSYDDGLMAYATGNYTEAGKQFMTAAEQGSPGAEHMLMRLFSEGKLQANNLNNETLKWTKKAASHGIAQAQFELAEIYAKQKGDVATAIRWYYLAANQNNPNAYFELGEIYKNGAKNVEADTQKSTRMYQIAASEFDVYAQKGNAKYQYTLAKMYQHSKGVRKNIRLAIKWMGKSAQQGHAVAQLELGRLYAKGDDVPRDINQAKHWLTLAAAQGAGSASTSAMDMLTELNKDGNTRLAYAF